MTTLIINSILLGAGLAMELVDAFLDATFEGGKHQRRVDMINAIEKDEL